MAVNGRMDGPTPPSNPPTWSPEVYPIGHVVESLQKKRKGHTRELIKRLLIIPTSPKWDSAKGSD